MRLPRTSMETTSQTSQTTKFQQIVAWIYKYSAFVISGTRHGLFPFGQELQKVVTDKSVMTRWYSTASKSNVIRVVEGDTCSTVQGVAGLRTQRVKRRTISMQRKQFCLYAKKTTDSETRTNGVLYISISNTYVQQRKCG